MPNETPPRLILASTSPRRNELLRQVGLVFETVAPDYEEDMTLAMSIDELAKHLAVGKAASVARQQPGAVVIGGDTFVEIDGELLGKPMSPEEAVHTLERLSGRTNRVHTGWAVVRGEHVRSGTVTSSVHMRPFSRDEAVAYVSTGEPLDKAGSYAVNGVGAVFVDRVEGDISAIIGLPLAPVVEAIRPFGVTVL
jgi:septum formation protein